MFAHTRTVCTGGICSSQLAVEDPDRDLDSIVLNVCSVYGVLDFRVSNLSASSLRLSSVRFEISRIPPFVASPI